MSEDYSGDYQYEGGINFTDVNQRLAAKLQTDSFEPICQTFKISVSRLISLYLLPIQTGYWSAAMAVASYGLSDKELAGPEGQTEFEAFCWAMGYSLHKKGHFEKKPDSDRVFLLGASVVRSK